MSFYFEYFQGRHKQIQYTVLDTDGNNVNLVGVDVIKWAASLDERSDPVLERSYPASGIDIVEIASGIFNVVLSGVTIDAGIYYHEAFYRFGGNDIHIDEGTMWVRPTII